MGTFPVLQQGQEVPVCLTNHDLPDFYMGDYSILGLIVSSLDGAYQVLSNQEFAVCKKSDHLAVDINHNQKMPDIVNLLCQNGIDCGMADIFDQVYQG